MQHNALPPGNLGKVPTSFVSRNSSIVEVNHQLIGMVPFLLPYLEQNALYDSIDADMFAIDKEPISQIWMLDPVTVVAATSEINLLRCPSIDPAPADRGELLFLNAYYRAKGKGTLVLETAPSLSAKIGRLGVTNYVGSMGYFGDVAVEEAQTYLGLIYTRSKTRMSQITDGSSHTLMVGEAIGQVVDGNLDLSYSWMGCGALPLQQADLRDGFGDGSDWTSFSSYHHKLINFCMADGSIRSIGRDIAVHILYALGGRSDGELSDSLEP
jgi:hypothetical protein